MMIEIRFTLKSYRQPSPTGGEHDAPAWFRFIVTDESKPYSGTIEVRARDRKGADSWRPASGNMGVSPERLLALALFKSQITPIMRVTPVAAGDRLWPDGVSWDAGDLVIDLGVVSK